jgi:4-hydroxy-2-oxoheptanedioate aldolase
MIGRVKGDEEQAVQFRKSLREGPMVGTFVSIAHPAIVEILGRTGFEALCLDSEHGPFTGPGIEDLIRAADVAGVPALVRVADVGPEIGRALDSGAAGVLVPMIETREQAAAVVAAVRYPPAGLRGAGPGRAAQYGLDFAGYLARANDDVAAIVQIETLAGVENVAEIVAVPGLDMVFIGPGDLSVSLGVPVGSPEHDAAIRTVADAARAAGVPLGMFCMTPEAVAQWAAYGATFFLLAGDLVLLSQGGARLAESGLAAVAAEVAA